MNQAHEIDPETWTAVDDAVLCFIRDRNEGKVLLIHKKTGLGKGLINGPGGRIEPGETAPDAAIRETSEETGLVVTDPVLRGDLYFQFTDGYSIRGYVFESSRWSGDLCETDEADPFWCSESEIPYDKMWVDDSWWFPHFLAGRKFRGRFIFDGEKMLSMSLDVEATVSDRKNNGLPRSKND